MTALIRAEILKLRTTQVWFWMLLAAVAVTVLFVVAQLAPSDGVRSAADVPDVFTASGTGYIVVFVLGTLGVTTEFRYQTITPTVLITPSRWTIVTAKMIAYLIVGIAYALVCTVVMIAVAAPWLAGLGLSVDFGSGDVWHAIGAVFLVLALFGIIGLGFGALVRNQIVAVSVGVIFLLILNNLIGAIPGVRTIYPYTPNGAVNSLFVIHGDRSFGEITLLPPVPAIFVLLAYAIVPAVIGASLTLDRDIT
jgi:ABC-type transport system involved in multi-copper enzyme maturation permease subunit